MDRLPVIIGIGEITDKPSDLADSLEPLALMSEALRRASQDSHCDLQKLDSIDVVHQVSWRYERTAAQLCARLNIRPARAVYGVTGGESPMRYIHEAALRIARGESEFAAVVGAEAQYAVNKAKTANLELPWSPIARDVENPFSSAGRINSIMQAHGATRPIHVYPFYENASHVGWGQSPAEALSESSRLYARISSVAAKNPYSWSTRAYGADEIATPSQDNRLVCFPYTKRTVANPAVNQGAAVILTTLERARALKIDESNLIYVWGGVAAMEPRDYLQRDQYVRSDAQDVVLNSLRNLAHDYRAELEALELYSCFPCVPKMTRRVLGLPEDITPTVTGGLSFFGAPLNNYMTHATCAMVRHLRSSQAHTGLLYGQGEFITKHHGIVVSRTPPTKAPTEDDSVQSKVDAKRGYVPQLLAEYEGPATIETHTVFYDRDGTAQNGVVVARTADDSRIMARVDGSDEPAIAALVDSKQSPIGLKGHISNDADGRLRLRL